MVLFSKTNVTGGDTCTYVAQPTALSTTVGGSEICWKNMHTFERSNSKPNGHIHTYSYSGRTVSTAAAYAPLSHLIALSHKDPPPTDTPTQTFLARQESPGTQHHPTTSFKPTAQESTQQEDGPHREQHLGPRRCREYVADPQPCFRIALPVRQ